MMEAAKPISVPEPRRRYFDLEKDASYDAKKRGEIPVIGIGGGLRVAIVALERLLERAAANVEGPPAEKRAP